MFFPKLKNNIVKIDIKSFFVHDKILLLSPVGDIYDNLWVTFMKILDNSMYLYYFHWTIRAKGPLLRTVAYYMLISLSYLNLQRFEC